MIWWILLLFISGLALIISEFFLPGGVLGAIGAVLVIISAVLGVYSYPAYGLFIVMGELIGVAVGIALGFYIIARTGAGKLLTLKHAQTQEAGYVSAASDTTLESQQGVVLTALRPSGTIKIGDKRIDAVSDGVFLDEGTMVRVVEIHGSRVVVEPVETE